MSAQASASQTVQSSPQYCYFEWQDAAGVWNRYDDHASWHMMKAQAGGLGKAAFVTGSFVYEVDMVLLQQTNLVTGTSRPVRQSSYCLPQTVVTAAAPPPAPIPPLPAPRVHVRSSGPNDSIFDDANGVLPPFKMDFRDLLDPAHPITKWWDAALFPMACEHSVFRYAAQQVPLQSPEAQVVQTCMTSSETQYELKVRGVVGSVASRDVVCVWLTHKGVHQPLPRLAPPTVLISGMTYLWVVASRNNFSAQA